VRGADRASASSGARARADRRAIAPGAFARARDGADAETRRRAVESRRKDAERTRAETRTRDGDSRVIAGARASERASDASVEGDESTERVEGGSRATSVGGV